MKSRFFLILIFSFAFALSFSQKAFAQDWVTTGSAGFSAGTVTRTSIAIDSTGTPYVVYVDGANSSKATVMKYNGSSWVTVGTAGFSAGSADYTSIAIDSNDIPYVVYSDGANSSKATVMKYNGSSWALVGTAGFSSAGNYMQIRIDSADTPYIVFQDSSLSSKATVMKYNGSSWALVGTAGFSAGTVFNIKIDFDSSDSPYVAYTDGANSSKATVMNYNGSSWVNVGSAGFSAGGTNVPSFMIDSTDVPYIAYIDQANSNKITVMKYNGSSWVNVGSAGFTSSNAQDVAFSLDSNDTPYIVYADQSNDGRPISMKYNGSSWVTFGTSLFNDWTADYLSLAIDSNDTLYLAFKDGASTNKASVMNTVDDPRIFYSGSFIESSLNDGSLTSSRVARLINDTFVNANSTLTENTHYTIGNKPTGLTSVMTVNSGGTNATLTFTGNAFYSSTDISNLTITFLSGAFTSTANAADVLNYSDANGIIDFRSFGGSSVLYGVDGSGSNSTPKLYTLGRETGTVLTTIGNTGHNLSGIAFQPGTGTLYGVSGNMDVGGNDRGLFTVNTSTGAAAWLGTIRNGSNQTLVLPDIAFSSDGTLYAFNTGGGTGDLHTIDITSCNGGGDTSCLATKVGTSGLSTVGGNGLAIDGDDNMYFFGNADDTYWKINPSTGAAISENNFLNPSHANYPLAAAAYDGDDMLYVSRLNFGSTPADLININVTTGRITSPGATTIMELMDAIGFLITADTTAPTIAEVTPVATPTTDTTPSYTFSSDEDGTITYGGSCSSSTTDAGTGNNTITFNTLSSGTYSDCTIIVTDNANNASSTLTITSFTIPSSSGPSGSSAGSQISNLLNMGKVEDAQKLLNQFPNALTQVNTGDTYFGTKLTKRLARGSRDNEVKILQQVLNNNLNIQLVVDGIFGPKTEAATILFQNKYNLVPDGIVGPITRGVANSLILELAKN